MKFMKYTLEPVVFVVQEIFENKKILPLKD